MHEDVGQDISRQPPYWTQIRHSLSETLLETSTFILHVANDYFRIVNDFGQVSFSLGDF